VAKNATRIVQKRPDGKFENKRVGNERATSVHDTQKEAESAARQNLQNEGGGELLTRRVDNGQFRSKDTIPPAKDPNPPKDTEH
jgi:hypothetical protein